MPFPSKVSEKVSLRNSWRPTTKLTTTRLIVIKPIPKGGVSTTDILYTTDFTFHQIYNIGRITIKRKFNELYSLFVVCEVKVLLSHTSQTWHLDLPHGVQPTLSDSLPPFVYSLALTKIFFKFLHRLNDKSGGVGNICQCFSEALRISQYSPGHFLYTIECWMIRCSQWDFYIPLPRKISYLSS